MSSRSSLLASSIALALAAVPVLSACATTANITDAWMSPDSDGSRHRTTFYTDSNEIHCIAQGGFGRADVTVEGVYHRIYTFDANNNLIPANEYFADAEIHPALSPGAKAPPTIIDFQLERPQGESSQIAPFPTGRFVCEIRLDGKLVEQPVFEILYAECPITQIIDGSACLGFYRENTVCPANGANADNPKCICTATSGWSCASQ